MACLARKGAKLGGGSLRLMKIALAPFGNSASATGMM
jgi:hypothetical protein